MQQALRQHQELGYEVPAEEIARLSPLLHKHVNMLGQYNFTLREHLAAGALRPLGDPAQWQKRFALVI